jgi:hypothetical protein
MMRKDYIDSSACSTPCTSVKLAASPIGAHAADLAKGHPGAQYRDNALSKTRF